MVEIYRYNLGLKFDQIAKENFDRVAIRLIDERPVTYKELNTLSNKISNYLLSIGVKRNDVVAILNNKTKTSYALMIACLKIGAIYTNLDAKSPIERFERMIRVCNPKLLFFYQKKNGIANKFNSNTIKCIDYESIDFDCLISKSLEVYPVCETNITGNTPAYIMFTSGSTGFPKGVVISHNNVLNFIQWSKQTYETTVNDVFTNINPMHFDNSVFDFYASLFTGATVIPIGEGLTRNPRRLLDALNQINPTIWFSVPSMLVYVLNMRALKENDLPTLRIVTFGGEGFPKNQLRKLWKYWGSRVKFINVYGPTECTCICSSYNVSEEDINIDNLLPLGHMSPNFYGLVLDENNKEVKLGEIGELCIGGPNVGIGYYNYQDKTQNVFIENPTITSHKEIIYRSGDLVKKDLETGMFLFFGRKDNQIKRMGYRIELEEIENAFNSINFIKESAVVYVNNEKYQSKIIAYLNSTVKDDDEVLKILKKYLPSYMLPDLYFYIEELPKNQNGKIDRITLKDYLN